MHPPHVLLCDLPRLAVELSRLELVVLADLVAGLSGPAESVPTNARTHDKLAEADGSTAPAALEVIVEARGATIVLHEAAAFAEDPGPHSYVLNLGKACLHLGGDGTSDEHHSAPLVTVSSADACVHETLRGSHNGSLAARDQFMPLMFRSGGDGSAIYPLMEDLPRLGFVSVPCAMCHDCCCNILCTFCALLGNTPCLSCSTS